MLPSMLEHDRKQAGWSIGRWLGVSASARRSTRELEAGARSPNFETWDRICKLFGWQQTFTTQSSAG
jgi:hypothetical protein